MSNSSLFSALAAIKATEDSFVAARESATAILRATRPGLEILRAAVNRARKQDSGLEEATDRLHAAEALLLGPAMAKLAVAARAYAEAAEALAAATNEEAVRPLKVEAA